MSKKVEQNRQDLWLRMQAYADNNKFEIDECVFYYVNPHLLITVPHLDHKLLDTTPLTS